MSADAIGQCKSQLQKRYAALFGDKFTTFEAHKEPERWPTWKYVNAELQPCASDIAKGALLSDPEIGICLFILSYDKATDIATQMAHALYMRSKLLPDANYDEANLTDDCGAWRVVINWLVEKTDQESWLEQIIHLRRTTGQFEEISIDSINNVGSWQNSIRDFPFPKLLLTCREIFRKRYIEEIDAWKSADQLVKQKLQGFSLNFKDANVRILAAQIENHLEILSSQALVNKQNVSLEDKPQSLKISHFRNIKDFEISFGNEDVSSVILHAPNGTGKSNIFEALSFAVCGVSRRYCSYIEDKDTGTTDYLDYIKPIRNPDSLPQITLNDRDIAPPSLTKENAANMLNAYDGTLLAQEDSQSFLHMDADGLGAIIMKNYSDIAQGIEEYVSDNMSAANAQRQNFLRQYGINLNVTKPTTAYEKITLNYLNRECPALPSQLVYWSTIIGDMYHAQAWQAWDTERSTIAKRISEDISADMIFSALKRWLGHYNEMVANSVSKLSELSALIQEKDFVTDKLHLWRNWLLASQLATPPDPVQLAKARESLGVLRRKLEETTIQGREFKARLDHLQAVKVYLSQHWTKEHPETCPTCESDVSERDSITAIVDESYDQLAINYELARKSYSEINAQLKSLQTELAIMGDAESPVTDEEKSRIIELLSPILKFFDQPLETAEALAMILEKVAAATQLPTVPESIDNEKIANNAIEILRSEFLRAQNTMELPGYWNEINKTLNTMLGSVVQNHLPETVGRIWNELILNITSARWLLPAGPSFKVQTASGRSSKKRVSVTLEGNHLARYILNKAEIHIAGLAWFFTRYFTQGRFFIPLIGMDDPAQEMDQPTYRELCRLWESLLRLHRFHKQPLAMFITLNQEERALDAVRATGGTLNTLAWGGLYQTKYSLKRIKLLGEAYKPKRPTDSLLFQNT